MPLFREGLPLGDNLVAMPSHTWEQIENLFLQAADLPLAEQSAFLDHACGDKDELRREVQSLLDSDRKSGEKITRAVEDEAQSLFGLSPIIGSRLTRAKPTTTSGSCSPLSNRIGDQIPLRSWRRRLAKRDNSRS